MFKRRDSLFEAAEAGSGGGGGEAEPSILEGAGNESEVTEGEAQGEQKAGEGEAGERPEWLMKQYATQEEQAKAYAELQKHVRAKNWKDVAEHIRPGMELPPETAEAYTYQPPEGMETNPEAVNGFRSKAHELKLSQSQYEGVAKYFYENVVPDLANQVTGYTKADAEKALKGAWKSDTEYKENLSFAARAFDAFADDADREQLPKIGNNPVVLKILAKVGREMGEDVGVSADAIMAPEDIEAVMKSDAYLKGSHPEHAKTVLKVQKHFQAQAVREKRQRA